MSGVCFEVPPASRARIEGLTASIRAHFKIKTPFFPLLEVVELWLPLVWPEFGFSVGQYDDMGNDHGRTFPGQDHIQVRDDVYDNIRRNKGRDRFTLAHELGHLFLHNDPALARNIRRSVDIEPFRSSEWQANSFAGSLLMPLTYLQQAASLATVVEDCGVTLDAARVQVRGMKNARLLSNNNLE
ncbi:ImmA/IrrE family metallo-endopeptidase [Luteimonas viscosa]|uniref:ImmA/IrrE family metallo-endopeptidase n=1 Tax=Luteimonas viscosa TaxID=1132694 RepID=A0A5D4XW86_9GAMM|nr:ImmA/IrrE family metallo-endopeptidase [Luteimonas viscosa]TYT27252.1 ImmA/IrrE family metallo-endopeptidase [Luteimonas viscosa]